MRRIAFAGALLFASTAGAQTLYKCVSHAGVSYQQTPCPATAQTVLRLETNPEPSPTAADLSRREAKARLDRAESDFLMRRAGTGALVAIEKRSATRSLQRRASHRSREETVCQAAKDKRERTLARVGLARNIDLLRNLDGEVADACQRG